MKAVTVQESLNRLEAFSAEGSARSSEKDDFSSDVSGSGSNTQSTNDMAGRGKAISEHEIIARKSRRDVFLLRAFVLSSLTAATSLVGAAVYLTTKSGLNETFHAEFAHSAENLLNTFKINIERKLSALDNLGLQMTSFAIQSGSTFPNVTLPDFAYRAGEILKISGASTILFLPAVEPVQKEGWEEYFQGNLGWIDQALEYAQVSSPQRTLEMEIDEDEKLLTQEEPSSLLYPIWQHYPTLPVLVNADMSMSPLFDDEIQATTNSQSSVFGRQWDMSNSTDALRSVLESVGLTAESPVSMIYKPVFDKLGLSVEARRVVGINTAIVNTNELFVNGLSVIGGGIFVVLNSGCGPSHTFFVQQTTAVYYGVGDLHDPEYTNMGEQLLFKEIFNEKDQSLQRFSSADLDPDYCPYSLAVYPSSDFEELYVSNDAKLYTAIVAAVSCLTILMFLAYDYMNTQRQSRILKEATQSRAIVSSLFPAAVQERLFRGDSSASDHQDGSNRKKLNDGRNVTLENATTRPIADLFPQTTVLFADIAGFTKWSSDRDPAQVFSMLQILFGAFDKMAKKRKVFKVETIGDCYVAVTGLPEPQDDHALRMAKYASECRGKFGELKEKLKVPFGEDTADLAMRFGLHSGPVTAGVLRGEKSRFQLFGATVATAAKMEHTGRPNKIQISSETADHIIRLGKGHWIFKRVDEVEERGGMQTFWVEPQSIAQEAKSNRSTIRREIAVDTTVNGDNRLISWTTDLLKQLLKRLIAHRQDMLILQEPLEQIIKDCSPSDTLTARDEIKYAITLPKFKRNRARTNASSIKLKGEVEEQLHKFVSMIASLYHSHPFHNFKHASNVCTNANKLMNSITDEDIYQRTSDPLTSFAIAFSALIHDVDHAGVPNHVLIKERPRLAAMYKNKSCAEQNSVDLAWNLLMDSDFTKLQETIFHTKEEFQRFRQIVVNVVMSTDIFDKDLNGDRDLRWSRAFGQLPTSDEDKMEDEELGNLRATVALECAMQMADIMHTTQHFTSYCRWNERLFEEMYRAFDSGRSKADPAENWYQGEIWFFDNIVLPMATKINASGVFGVSGQYCLHHATENKKNWAINGGRMVLESLDRITRAIESDKHHGRNQTGRSLSKSLDPKTEQVSRKSSKPKLDTHLINWNLDMFKRFLRQIVAQRMHRSDVGAPEQLASFRTGSCVRDELSHFVEFQQPGTSASNIKVDPDSIVLTQGIVEQLLKLLHNVAEMYHNNPFHNFKHASNVATTSNRYLHRIDDEKIRTLVLDPMTQFAIVFSALIHDLDHPGCPNDLLAAEDDELAVKYSKRSVAEQHSVDTAWELIMQDDYAELRDVLFCNEAEMIRFRKLMVHCVMATDLCDQQLKENRLCRWKQAFTEGAESSKLSETDLANLRATVVVEHILMAADVGHITQHWHSFKRWNERLFFESYDLYKNGRVATDPSLDWYTNEIKFIDDVVLPITHRLSNSGVFSATIEENVRSATLNRKEWVIEGGSAIDELKKRYVDFKKGNIA